MFKLLTSDQWNKENHLRHTPRKRFLRILREFLTFNVL